MCENRLTLKRDSWLLGVLNIAGRSLGKLYPTNYLATVVVVYLHKQVMKREHQKIKKKKKKEKKRQTILDKTCSIYVM